MEPSSPLTASNSSADLRDVFHIKNVGYDVVLSRANNTVSWTPMSLNPEADGSSHQKTNFFNAVFKRTKLSSLDSLSNDGCVEFKNMYGARIIHRRPKELAEGQGLCIGISILTYEEQSGNKLLEKSFVFSNPCKELCKKWVEEIENILAGFPERPKNLRVLCQPHAGNKQGLMTYGSVVEPIFKNANTNIDFSEVENTGEQLTDLIEDMDLTKYDCLVVIGGDGTVNKVVNALMNKSNSTICPADWLSSNVIPNKPKMKIGVIPTGTTNHIAQSVIGTCDPVTAAIHISLGHYRYVDLCSVHHDGLLYKWVFNSQYGFAGNVLTFAERYKSVLRSKKMEGGFLKALTQSKLRSYMCKVEYRQIEDDDSEEKNACTRGCTVCRVPDKLDESGLQETQQTYADSVLSSEWKVGPPQYFMNVGIFTIPGLCSFAPEGLSKFTHLADGSMHLSLVHNTERSEFLHFLKRHTTSKDQFDLPFVTCYKVRQVRITPYPQITDDKGRSSPVLPMQSETKEDSVKGSDSGDSSSTSASRKGSTNKKKKKAKADTRSLSIWNVDNEPNPPLDLEFRVHHAVLKICGEGTLNSFTEADEPKISCLFT
ncbi:kinase [Octopus vulgaris]|nr:kinase [Octopus vulgaris]